MLFTIIVMAYFLAVPQGVAQKPESQLHGMSADEAAIRRIPEAWILLYNSGDAAKVAALYSEDGYYLSAHILAHGRKAIQAYWERGIKAGGI